MNNLFFTNDDKNIILLGNLAVLKSQVCLDKKQIGRS